MTVHAAMRRSAELSPCGTYRYALYRSWEPPLGAAIFIMLNPSTADASIDDPTIRRCIGYAKTWGYGELTVVNLFALRATNPRELAEAADPVGPDNDSWLDAVTYSARFQAVPTVLVAAWGAHPLAAARYEQCASAGVLRSALHCLDVTASGAPRHPLYLSAKLRLRTWPATTAAVPRVPGAALTRHDDRDTWGPDHG